MKIRSSLVKALSPIYTRHPRLRDTLIAADGQLDRLRHTAAHFFPQLIRPDPRSLFIALTANCTHRCDGCRYGRDFMRGKQLPWPIIRDLLDDAKKSGISNVRLYGGEPLLHKDLPRIVEHATGLGLHTWVTTNGFLLRDKIDELYNAGLRKISIGLYGIGDNYDLYTHSREGFARMEEGIAYARERYGKGLFIGLDWLLMRPTCSTTSLRETWEFATRYNTPLWVNLIHYSLPYFITGDEHELQFHNSDRPAIEEIVNKLIYLKEQRPEMIPQRLVGLRAIPDWLLKGPDMRIPCDNYRLIWVGADGTVQMCYVQFKLGNLYEQRLADMLFTDTHCHAAQDAFQLNCPNCHCGFDRRTLNYAKSFHKYSKVAPDFPV